MGFFQAVKFDQSLPISQARKDADRQLAVRIQDAGLRAWLLMNMKQDLDTKLIGWKINLAGIHSAFYKDIARFPSVSGTFNKWVQHSKFHQIKPLSDLPDRPCSLVAQRATTSP